MKTTQKLARNCNVKNTDDDVMLVFQSLQNIA